jgi:hypothetical protein
VGFGVAGKGRILERRGGDKRVIKIAQILNTGKIIAALIALAVDMPLRRREGLGAVA